MSKRFNVPQSFTAYHKIERFGGKIADPFELNTQNKQEIEGRVFTSKHDKANPGKQALAVKLIENSFKNSKSIKVGMSKPGKTGVVAKNVMPIMPSFLAMSHKVLQVTNDECAALWEEKLEGITDRQAVERRCNLGNGQLLVNQREDVHAEKKFMLCRLNSHQKMSKNLKQELGTEKSALEAHQFESIRNYAYS